MFQTVGHSVITYYAEALGLPLYQTEIKRKSVAIEMDYGPDDKDEV